jgi:hypothetical protein
MNLQALKLNLKSTSGSEILDSRYFFKELSKKIYKIHTLGVRQEIQNKKTSSERALCEI